jgi:GNAT superfamily N-acetyltransferase
MLNSKFFQKYFQTFKYLIFEQKLNEWSHVTTSNSEIICGPISKDEFLASAGKFREIMPNAEERFDIGDVFYGAKINGKYAHIKWIAFNQSYVSEIESLINLPADSVYLYDGYTLPEYRGLRLTSTVLDEAFKFLSEIGIRRAYSFIMPNNFRILKSKDREKARRIGLISFYKAFRFKHILLHSETKEDKNTIKNMFQKK